MKISQTEEFIKNLKALPVKIKNLYKKQEKIFENNWRDSRLHRKKLRGEGNVFSFRITRRYRVLFVFTGNQSALFVSIGHRKNIYE